MLTVPALPKHRPADALISCVIPAYNEAAHLADFLRDLRKTLAGFAVRYEIIVINDGSRDNTDEIMASLLHEGGLRYISFSRNFGKEAALSAGIDAAQGDAVILMDSDYQHPLELLPEMTRLWRDGIDMVYGVISDRSNESRLKRWGTGMFYYLMESGSPITIPRNAGDFRLMDKKVVDALRQLPERNRFMKGLYAWVGFKVEALPYTPDERMHGDSRFSSMRLFRLALDGLTAFTTWPLRLVSLVGVAFALMAMSYAAYLVGDYLSSGNPVSGWTTIVTAVLFFAGVNLISLGVVGEYVARIFDEVKGRPLYVVRRRQGRSADNGARSL